MTAIVIYLLLLLFFFSINTLMLLCIVVGYSYRSYIKKFSYYKIVDSSFHYTN